MADEMVTSFTAHLTTAAGKESVVVSLNDSESPVSL
jgi:hypothetical protein